MMLNLSAMRKYKSSARSSRTEIIRYVMNIIISIENRMEVWILKIGSMGYLKLSKVTCSPVLASTGILSTPNAFLIFSFEET